MIARSYILKNLGELDRAFRSARSQKHGIYFSKLAILELCGWIEISMDTLILEHCGKHVAEGKNTKIVQDSVKRTYGFDYDDHFRRMLINLIGAITCERLEARIPVATRTKLAAQLNSLKVIRNGLAHTYLKGPTATLRIDAPSFTIARFADIHNGLKAFEVELRALKH